RDVDQLHVRRRTPEGYMTVPRVSPRETSSTSTRVHAGFGSNKLAGDALEAGASIRQHDQRRPGDVMRPRGKLSTRWGEHRVGAWNRPPGLAERAMARVTSVELDDPAAVDAAGPAELDPVDPGRSGTTVIAPAFPFQGLFSRVHEPPGRQCAHASTLQIDHREVDEPRPIETEGDGRAVLEWIGPRASQPSRRVR